MIGSNRIRSFLKLLFSTLPLVLLLAGVPIVSAVDEKLDLSTEEIMRLGERMYRDGVLPSGEAMQAFVSNDVPVDGTSFTCVSCHLHSGMGSIEGEVVTPPTNGRILYQPRESYIKGAEFVPYISNYAKYLPVRPAYTDESLALLIAGGIDPIGRSVLDVMPRYEIGDRDMEILIAYLKSLSDEPPPGVAESHISFATVIVEGTDPVKVKSMLLPLQYSVDRKNSLAHASMRNDRVARMGYNMLGDLARVTFSLSKWILKGPPETWRAQLDEYYREEPVYALLGGISEGEWEPVHRFCEEMKIPNLFPVVDTPVISESDWYTLYFSRGARQEGESAARYLSGMAELFKGQPVVQVVRDSKKGKELAEGFRDQWNKAGRPKVKEVKLADGETLTPERLKELLLREKPAALLVWDDASALPAISGLSGTPDLPGLVLASGTYLEEELWSIPAAVRDQLYFTWPYRLPREDVRFDFSVKKILVGKNAEDYDRRVLKQAYITQEMLSKGLMEMRTEYYRDFLLDTIGMMRDMYLPLYERLSFGPGQRYASKGCYIVQIGKGETPRMERMSEWVIQ